MTFLLPPICCPAQFHAEAGRESIFFSAEKFKSIFLAKFPQLIGVTDMQSIYFHKRHILYEELIKRRETCEKCLMTNFLLFAGPDIESHCWALTSTVINSKRTNCPSLGQKRGICEESSTFTGAANQFWKISFQTKLYK